MHTDRMWVQGTTKYTSQALTQPSYSGKRIQQPNHSLVGRQPKPSPRQRAFRYCPIYRHLRHRTSPNYWRAFTISIPATISVPNYRIRSSSHTGKVPRPYIPRRSAQALAGPPIRSRRHWLHESSPNGHAI